MIDMKFKAFFKDVATLPLSGENKHSAAISFRFLFIFCSSGPYASTFTYTVNQLNLTVVKFRF